MIPTNVNCSTKISGNPIINFLCLVLWWISRMVIYMGSAAPKTAISRSVNSGIRCPERLALNLSKMVTAIPARETRTQQIISCTIRESMLFCRSVLLVVSVDNQTHMLTVDKVPVASLQGHVSGPVHRKYAGTRRTDCKIILQEGTGRNADEVQAVVDLDHLELDRLSA